MSELEIKRRQEYKRNRKRWTVIQLVAIVLLLVTSLGSFLIYTKIDQNQYIEYAEKSDIDYKVQYTENEFFDEEWIGKGQAYISALIGDISADFSYKMDVAADMSLDYTYWIDAKLVVSSTKEGKTYYSQEESLLPKQNEFKKTASAVKVEETLSIDYVKFNKVAKSFVKTHNLKDASSFLLVTLYVDTTVSHNGYENKCNSSYSTTLNIPLAEDTFSIYSTSSKAAGKVDSFEFKGSVNKAIFLNIGISSSALVVILAVILFVFLHLTRNEDITYAAKVRKILNSYSSFIQRIEGEFNFDGYQVVNVKTFTEMLGIRDTIQSPVLMLENRDETMTQFFIPTNTKILYVFEIKVDNYDEIYSRIEAEKLVEPTLEFCVDDTDAPEEAVVMAAVAEPEEPTVELESENTEDKPLESTVTVEEIMSHLVEEVDEGEDGGVSLSYIDESGEKIKIACKRSFTANLIQSNPQVKKYYNEIKNLILSYKGVKDRSNWRIESFNKGRVNLFKLKIRGKTICLYCALNPDDFDKAKYFHEKTDAKMFEGVPMMVRIKSDRGLKRAKELVELVMANFEIAINPKASIIDYAGAFPYDTTKSLVERGLIKILIPGAVAAEPKPHHHAHKEISEKPKITTESK